MKTSVVRMVLLAGVACLSIQPVQAGENSAATVHIDLNSAIAEIQTTRVAAVNDVLDVDVVIRDAVDLIGFQVVVTFPPSILELQQNEVTEGEFLKRNGVPTYFTEPTFGSGKVEVTDVVMQASVSDAQAADGDGVLVHLKFKVLATGAAAIAFSTSTADTQLLRDNTKNPGGADIDDPVALGHASGATVNPTTYTLTTSASSGEGGSVAKDPDQASYTSGTPVLLTANASAGYTFSGWGGDASGSTNPLTITMDADKTVTANFTASTPTYTLTVSPSSGGSVTKNPDQVNYISGTSVELTANASAGYAFSGWGGDASGSTNPLTITMNSNKTVTANFTTGPVLTIAKTDNGTDPVDPNAQIVYTITYGNMGVSDANNAVIVETLPAGLVFVSCTGSGAYVEATRTITWTIGTIPAQTTGQTVSFTVTLDSTWGDGGVIQNSALTIDCDETEAVQAAIETTAVNDKKAPAITPVAPTAGQELIPVRNLVTLQIADRSGVDSNTVKISVRGCLIYDGAQETAPGEYDSNSVEQAVRGVCRRTGEATSYTFTFIPSVSLGYQKKVTVRAEATDLVGNCPAAATEYFFWTVTRTFGRNARVNSYEELIQDNPASAVGPAGTIWVVWDQTNASGDGDIYVGLLPAGAESFEASMAVAATASNERHPAIAVDADGVAYVVWQAADPNHPWDIYTSHSTNGTTWSTPVKVCTGDPNNTSDQTAPAIAVGRGISSSVYVVWEDRRSGDSDIWLGTSTDHGGTWAGTQITTNTADQTEPIVGVDLNDVVHVAWTDARNSATTGTDIYGTSSDFDEEPWPNIPLVEAMGNQSSLTAAASQIVHLAWIADVNGFGKVLYANDSNEPPFVGTGVADADEPNAIQSKASLGVHSVFGSDTVFAAWEDGRNVVGGNGDTDIYFAESSSPFGTNILVNDDAGASAQTKPVIGVNREGNPYIVWVDNRNGDKDIYYAAATDINDAPLAKPLAPWVTVDPNGVTAVSCAERPNLGIVITDVNVLPLGVEPGDISFREVTNPPALPTRGFGLCYDLGPDGTVFSAPVTLRIPLAAGHPVYPEYRVYRYGPNSQWTTEGIHNPATRKTNADGDYLEVQVDHFTLYATGGVAQDGGGGGCALAPWSHASPVEYGLPFVGYLLALLAITYVDRRRHRAGGSRHP
jgi:uncharacterized repeat protein (TIGR01451 family)/uncharacterized repeat protein (TIGR02543 family)